MGKYKQGIFKPKFKAKYKGNLAKNPPVYRSSWELKVMLKLDDHPDVLEWSSEGIVIPYRSPVDNKIHRYFVDFYIKLKNKNGEINTLVVEVKPFKETMPPVKKKNMREKRFLQEVFTWGVNEAKWNAAREWCKKKNYKFEIWTEKDLGI